jgi:rhodanese-related sulfurtransferase
MKKGTFLHTLLVAILIGIFSLVLGAIVNAVRPDSVSYNPKDFRPPKSELKPDQKPTDNQLTSEKRSCEPLPIFLDDAYTQYFETRIGIFIDTRLEEEFKTGHIPGAINLPNDKTASAFNNLKDQLPLDGVYIFYCHEGCDSAEQTAYYFCGKGYKDGNVFLADNSFEYWIEQGYPVE